MERGGGINKFILISRTRALPQAEVYNISSTCVKTGSIRKAGKYIFPTSRVFWNRVCWFYSSSPAIASRKGIVTQSQGTVERRRRSNNETVGGRFILMVMAWLGQFIGTWRRLRMVLLIWGQMLKGVSVWRILLLDYNSYKYGEWESLLLFSSCGCYWVEFRWVVLFFSYFLTRWQHVEVGEKMIHCVGTL